MSLRAVGNTLGQCLASSRYRVAGDSMLPTLSDGQYVLARRMEDPAQAVLPRGQVVVIRHPTQHNLIYIKRVIGLPNESLLLRDGLTYLDDRVLEEPYLVGETPPVQQGEWWNGPEEYFLMGDHRSNSEDSRRFGPVSRDLILGQVWFRYWPPKAWGRIR